MFEPDTERWSHVTDLRGDTIYDTESQREARVDYLGDLKEKHTKLKPPTSLHKFKNKKWDLSPDDHARDLERKLMKTVDGAHAAAQRLALGYKSTPRQIERYRDKYERAVKKEFSTELNKKIISKHKAYQETVGKRIDLIEVLRGRVATLIKGGQLDRAEKIIKQFDAREGGYALDSGLDEAEFAKEFEKITT
ncbi:MAG: hypothetical protein H0A75_00105 [Candidatus Methanofishera endochildressiae]|uniref:Uncharacterized protein n=1 Tax=Candidatus Methanofishera endochildressiae TaxID=2738884 RepID=A0A7Z0MME5_9GAMM|nr:hypothetical protein [Candidatus Methanofishera endochildressiae]